MVGVHQVDGARAYIAKFQYPCGRKLILNIDIVLPHQRGVKTRVQERLVEVGTCERSGVIPAGRETERRRWIGVLHAESILSRRIVKRDRVRIPLFQTVYEPVTGYAVVKHACPAA